MRACPAYSCMTDSFLWDSIIGHINTPYRIAMQQTISKDFIAVEIPNTSPACQNIITSQSYSINKVRSYCLTECQLYRIWLRLQHEAMIIFHALSPHTDCNNSNWSIKKGQSWDSHILFQLGVQTSCPSPCIICVILVAKQVANLWEQLALASGNIWSLKLQEYSYTVFQTVWLRLGTKILISVNANGNFSLWSDSPWEDIYSRYGPHRRN